MNRAQDFRREHPSLFFLDLEDPEGLERYLAARGWLARGERIVRVERAGEGNMNLVVRAVTSTGSLIVKQSRPWVEKYDAIDAPWDRARVEAAFYAAVAGVPEVAAAMPALLGTDAEARILVMQDLGESRDYTWVYAQAAALDPEGIDALAHWLAALHRVPVDGLDPDVLANRDMRTLDHEHIFDLPLRADDDRALDEICPGLDAAAAELQRDADYVARVHALGARYLADAGDDAVLLHGDYYPGSWLETDRGTRIIDPEFCFVGPAELDVGVALAHLALARQPGALVDRFLAGYSAPDRFDERTALAFAGVEIMRRLIGVAQLPIPYGLEVRRALLDRSRRLVLEEDREALA